MKDCFTGSGNACVAPCIDLYPYFRFIFSREPVERIALLWKRLDVALAKLA